MLFSEIEANYFGGKGLSCLKNDYMIPRRDEIAYSPDYISRAGKRLWAIDARAGKRLSAIDARIGMPLHAPDARLGKLLRAIIARIGKSLRTFVARIGESFEPSTLE